MIDHCTYGKGAYHGDYLHLPGAQMERLQMRPVRRAQGLRARLERLYLPHLRQGAGRDADGE